MNKYTVKVCQHNTNHPKHECFIWIGASSWRSAIKLAAEERKKWIAQPDVFVFIDEERTNSLR